MHKNLTKKTHKPPQKPNPSLQENICNGHLHLKWPWPCESVRCMIPLKKKFLSTVEVGTKKHYGNDLIISIFFSQNKTNTLIQGVSAVQVVLQSGLLIVK